MGMRIFKLDVGETDWVYAQSMFEALKFYNKETGFELEEIENIEEVPEDQWDNLKLFNEDEGNTKTFREAVLGEINPFIIASTAY